MNFKSLIRHLSILTLALWSVSVSAAPLDKSANSKIDEAINVHYLSTNFDKAEGLLLGTLKACGERCSPSVKARAWMYVGIVRGAGKQDNDGATAAFVEALGLDPNVALDKDLATDELRALFNSAKGDASPAAPVEETVPLEESGPSEPEAPPVNATLECSPDVTDVETRRPIPVSCKTPEAASRVVVYYKAFGAKKYTQLTLGKSGGSFVGTIPCAATGAQGTLTWYAKAMSSGGQTVDTSQSEDDPHAIEIVESTSTPPPSLPGKKPPNRCADPADCPEDMRGTPACPGTEKEGKSGGGGWGDSCKSTSDCGEDMYCNDGTCESPPSCETDADCSGGTCQDELCRYADSGGDDDDDEGGDSGSASKWRVGLHIGIDIAQMEGQGVCNPLLTGDTYQCFIAGNVPYTAATQSVTGGPSLHHNPTAPVDDQDPQRYLPSRSGLIESGLVPSTIRIMASIERALTNKISLEGRVGMSLRTRPGAGLGQKIHLGVQGKYWFTGMGKSVASFGDRLKFYGLVGAGMGTVDAKKGVLVQDFADDTNSLYASYAAPPATYCPTANAMPYPYCELPVDAFRKMGPGYIAAGAGMFLNLGGQGPQIQLAAQVMLPNSGFVLQPSGGWVIGF